MEASNLQNAEFKCTYWRDAQQRIDYFSETFNIRNIKTKIQYLKRNQSEMKNRVTKMKIH